MNGNGHLSNRASRQRAALAIRDAGVQRIEGIDAPYRLEQLSPGINLIHGPNAVGKSRTAFALQALIWPEGSSTRTELTGSLTIGDELVRIEIEGTRANYFGWAGSGPGTPPLEQRDRYLLTLHDLLKADNREFAATILREAAGGYDLKAAREEVKALSAPRPGSRKHANDLHEAKATVRQLQAEHASLHAQERSLNEARRRLAHADEAVRQVAHLEAAIEYADATQALEEARIQRGAFPDPIGRMTGTETEDLKSLQEKRAVLLDRRKALEHTMAAIETDLERTGFTSDLPSGVILGELRERLADLRDLEGELRQSFQQIATHGALLSDYRDRIAPGITDAQLSALDAQGIRELARLSLAFRDLDAELRAEEILRSWLGSVGSPADLDQLRRAVHLLARRLRMAGSEDDRALPVAVRLVLIGASVVIVALAAVLAVKIAPVWILAAVAVIPLAVVAFRAPVPADGEIESIRREYESLGVEVPTSWASENVALLLDDLHKRRASAEVDYEKASRWSSLDAQRERTSARREAVRLEREALLERYGIAPEDADPEHLRSMADALDRWRQGTSELDALRVREAETRREVAAQLKAINTRLEELGAEPVEDSASAHATIEDLTARIGQARELGSRLENCERELDNEVLPAIAERDGEIAELYARHGLDSDDAEALADLCERVEPCREAQRRVEAAEVILTTKRDRLKDAPEYFDWQRSDLETALDDARAKKEERDGIQKEIADIAASLREAKRQTRLEDAIAGEQAALESLAQRREADYEAAAAWKVAEFIQARNRTENRPAVFRIADEHLKRFTAGAFRLELDEGQNPEFRAIETSTGRSLPLNKLSSGTRVQLLIAVRLAFIEATERGPQLPLILDEVLGNTDDVRAYAIIDAAIEIARGGRQVVYFTAQQDEVAKWRARIADQDGALDCHVVDLAKVRSRGAAGLPVRSAWEPPRAVPIELPDGTDHAAARELLHVPSVDLWADHIDGVDLWYLLPDVESLVSLRLRSLRAWGQYRTLYVDGRFVAPVPEQAHRAAIARAGVIDEVRIAWQRGRPRPITSHGLRDTGLITDAFIEQVVALCEELDGNCVELLDALRNRRVSGFRTKVIEEMEEYFRQEGFVTDLEPLTDDMIRARAFAAAHEAIEDGLIAERDIDDLLWRLAGPGERIAAGAD